MSNDHDYPTDLEADVTLANDRRVHIRPLRQGEADPIRSFYAQLSPRSRYLRFFSPMPALPDSVVRLLTSVDYRRKLALVAEAGEAAELAARARCRPGPAARAAGAHVVRDDWQQQHVGTELATRVLEAAEALGFRRFVVHVTADNAAIRRLLRHVGSVVSANASGGVSEIEFVRRTHAVS